MLWKGRGKRERCNEGNQQVGNRPFPKTPRQEATTNVPNDVGCLLVGATASASLSPSEKVTATPTLQVAARVKLHSKGAQTLSGELKHPPLSSN